MYQSKAKPMQYQVYLNLNKNFSHTWYISIFQNPLLGGGDLSTIIERVPVGNSETDGYSKYHNRGGVSSV